MSSSLNAAAKRTVGPYLGTALLCALLAACGGGGEVSTNADQSTRRQPIVGGASTAGEADATRARFNVPKGLAMDAAGNIYVADSGNSTIRKITPKGTVTTLAGTPGVSGSTDGTGAAARFNSPSNIAVGADGNLYVADTGNHTIRKITPDGLVTTLAGTAGARGSANGTGAAAEFNVPWGVAADAAGNVYVADTYNYLIRKITPQGVVSTLAGKSGTQGGANGAGTNATFHGPRGMTIDSAGNLYITDWYGPGAPMLAQTSTFVRKITPAGEVTTVAGNYGNGPTPPVFRDTWTITMDGAGNTYVASQNSVRKVTAAGAVSTVAESATFTSLLGVTIDQAGNLFVADESQDVIARVTQGGDITIVAGQPGQKGSADAAP
jgi:sugar lactone lactonase YvrE